MKKQLYLLLSLIPLFTFSQSDFSENWKDLYSYNNVKDFTINNNVIYAISESAMFTYNIDSKVVEKKSSINGLSGKNTSSIYFDEFDERVCIGYENGLIEFINKDDSIFPLTGLADNSILVNKRVNGFYASEKLLYVYGEFGILEIKRDKQEIGNSFKLSNSGIPEEVTCLEILDDTLYAGTKQGLYSIDISADSNPILLKNWTLVKPGNIENLILINGVFYTVENNKIFNISSADEAVITTNDAILDVSNNLENSQVIIVMKNEINLYNNSSFSLESKIELNSFDTYAFEANKVDILGDAMFFNTEEFGILSLNLTNNNFSEIHPEGPNRNDAFSITARNENVWITYGGYKSNYNFSFRRLGVSGFSRGQWYNIPHGDLNIRDITKIEINPNNQDNIYIASYFNGVVVADYNEEQNKWIRTKRWTSNSTEGGLPKQAVPSFEAVTSYLAIDNNKKLWVNSLFAENYEFLSRYNFNTEIWETKVDFSRFFSEVNNDIRFIKTIFDAEGNLFCGTKQNGLVVLNQNYNENLPTNNLNNRIAVFNKENSNLPSDNVRAIAVDDDKRVWIGTALGLVVFDDYDNLFESNFRSVEKIIIEESDGLVRELLGDLKINDIIIDTSGNKYIATETAGVFHISNDGQTTFNIFNTTSSPLPTNAVIDLDIDPQTGLIYMVTDKGVLVYDSETEPFGSTITEVVAYPNPAVKNRVGHEQITIVAKDGNGIPNGTNVKIMDVSGRLVFETNISEEGQNIGGKVVWNKRNLRGKLVASGVYIVLLSSPDASETTTTKIAIVN